MDKVFLRNNCVRCKFFSENSDLERDVEQDQFTITVAPYDDALHADLEEFFTKTFDTLDRLENHTFVQLFSLWLDVLLP